MSSGKNLPKAKLFRIKVFYSVKNFINLLCINFSSISFLLLVQGEMKNKSWLGGGKYSENVL